MQRLILILFIVVLSNLSVYSQHNCANPTPIVICPGVLLTGETNLGMLDDGPASCNIPGEDLVYKISIINGAQKLFVSVMNATTPMILILEETTCNGICSSTSAPAGSSNHNFTINPASEYFLWVDASGTTTYDISFGADTGTIMINIPNTQGDLQFDSSMCNLPVFHPSKPFFQVEYNNVYQTLPMTLSPLFMAGNMCISVFFKNTSGDEGIKRFEFDFNPFGYINISAPDSFSGFYNAGYWRLSVSGNTLIYLFDDSAGIGKGDFTGTPDSCVEYEFCFTLTPLSNDPVITNVDVLIHSDGFGAGYSGMVSSGCCPSPVPNCMGGGSGQSAGSGQAFGFGFDDPGGALPIELLSFTAEAENNAVILKWTTISETNNDFFSIEKSANGLEWHHVKIIEGAGTSSSARDYEYKDVNPFSGISYYRLKQTDFDGQSSYSEIITAAIENSPKVNLFPQPADISLIIHSEKINNLHIQLYDIHGNRLYPETEEKEFSVILNTASLASGIYMILVIQEERIIQKQKFIVLHSK